MVWQFTWGYIRYCMWSHFSGKSNLQFLLLFPKLPRMPAILVPLTREPPVLNGRDSPVRAGWSTGTSGWRGCRPSPARPRLSGWRRRRGWGGCSSWCSGVSCTDVNRCTTVDVEGFKSKDASDYLSTAVPVLLLYHFIKLYLWFISLILIEFVRSF